MIVGHGDIAKALEGLDDDEFLFFASGVSNSGCTDEREFARERDLLLAQPRDKHIVYFSSKCAATPENAYARHKQNMESLIVENFERYTIVRIGNILWGDNPHTFINVFRRAARENARVKLLDVKRSVVTREDFREWVQWIKKYRSLLYPMDSATLSAKIFAQIIGVQEEQ